MISSCEIRSTAWLKSIDIDRKRLGKNTAEANYKIVMLNVEKWDRDQYLPVRKILPIHLCISFFDVTYSFMCRIYPFFLSIQASQLLTCCTLFMRRIHPSFLYIHTSQSFTCRSYSCIILIHTLHSFTRSTYSFVTFVHALLSVSHFTYQPRRLEPSWLDLLIDIYQVSDPIARVLHYD